MSFAGKFWTDDKVAEAKRLYVEEGFSATQVCGMIGAVSRNAVIGIAHRQGWARSPLKGLENNRSASRARGPRAAPKQTRRRPLDGLTFTGHAKPKQQYQERPQPASGPIDSPNAKVWTERAFGECAYPISGEGADTVSCANPCSGSYCPAHAAVMYVAGSASRSRASGKERYFALVQARGHVRSFDEWAAA
jgi:GcrA cell cycle regulator